MFVCRYFKPRFSEMEDDISTGFGDAEKALLAKGIETYGVSAWDEIRTNLLPKWVRTNCLSRRLHTCLTRGSIGESKVKIARMQNDWSTESQVVRRLEGERRDDGRRASAQQGDRRLGRSRCVEEQHAGERRPWRRRGSHQQERKRTTESAIFVADVNVELKRMHCKLIEN
jgi:hypothetical protein